MYKYVINKGVTQFVTKSVGCIAYRQTRKYFLRRLQRQLKWDGVKTVQMHRYLNADDLSANNPEMLTITITKWATLQGVSDR